MNSDKTDSPNPVIQIERLQKSFGSLNVLKDFNLELLKGENVAVLGKSGSGKSVLIKCIIGLMKPDSGSIKVLGEEIPDLSHKSLDDMRLKVGFLFQSNALYDSMTVRENLEFPLRRHELKNSKKNINELVMEALTNVGLANAVDMMPDELSGGMRKRIALARTLILRPKIVLYDEPTTGLDPITSREISQLMLDLQKKYKTSSIIISHDMHCVKMAANRLVMLVDGVCRASGTYEEMQKLKDAAVKQFFN
jgi:phospholipid/cholesterol/gamma-HCH transport system ATP-binding protein